MSEFDDIRPYNDSEVRSVLNRLLRDNEFLDAVFSLKRPGSPRLVGSLARPFVRKHLAAKLKEVNSVFDLQCFIESYLQEILDKTVTTLSISGLEKLSKNQAHLFVSNHRDIAMDPAFVNWVLYQNGFSTLRIAIGDNLLTKPFASELMRLNKSFIVKRSVSARREKLQVAKLLSKYIHHSIVHDNENVWIAQREGQAKDGVDKTNPAIVSMLVLNKEKPQPFGEYIREAKIVPVSISYEYDPCDFDKACELFEKQSTGEYNKEQHEDVRSIAKGITGFKGNVHLSFGTPLESELSNVEEATAELDQQINSNYVLHSSNCFAYELLENRSPAVAMGENGELFTEQDLSAARNKFQSHIAQGEPKYRQTLLKSYANPVYLKLGE